jgi:hypothetical protein
MDAAAELAGVALDGIVARVRRRGHHQLAQALRAAEPLDLATHHRHASTGFSTLPGSRVEVMRA